MKDIPIKINGNHVAANEYNPLTQELKNVVVDSGQVLNEADNFQTSKAAANYSASGDFYTDVGAVDVYVLNPQGAKKGPTSYVAGIRVRFLPANTNTGVATVNVSGLGAKTIKTYGDLALVGGELQAGLVANLEYDGVNFRLSNHHQNILINSSFINGMKLSNNTINPNTDVDIDAGSCSDSGNNVVMVNQNASFFKNLANTWVEGSGNGGRAATVPLTTNTWYHYFSIIKVDGTFDAGYDTNINASALMVSAASYSFFRRIGSVLTDGSSNIIPTYMVISPATGIRKTMWKDVIAANVVNPTELLGVLKTIPTPPDLNISAIIRSSLGISTIGAPANGGYARAAIFSPLRNDPVSIIIDNEWTVILGYHQPGNNAQDVVNAVVYEVVTNTSSQIKYAFNKGGQSGAIGFTLHIDAHGWIE